MDSPAKMQNTPRPVRLGLLGGTFDPVHNGHLAVAQFATSFLSLDQVHFLPAATSPFKSLRTVTQVQHRLAMLEAALADRPAFVLSRLEVERPPPSFTIDTILQFRADLPSDTEIYFLIGADAFLEINSWKSWRKLFELLSFAVFPRRDDDLKKITAFLYNIFPRPQQVDGQNIWIIDQNNDVHGHKIIYIPMPPIAISSTVVRSTLFRGQDCSFMLPKVVAKYICKHHLYSQ